MPVSVVLTRISHWPCLVLDGARGISAIVCDTDGVDGAAEIAGACIDDETLEKSEVAGLDHRDALRRQDAHTFFQSLDCSVISGPTRQMSTTLERF